jgi:glycosyltransferase involved in cell wall biosynthesis
MFYRDFGVRAQFDKQFARKIEWDIDLLSGYPHTFLWNASPISDTFNPFHAMNPGAFTRLLSGFDAVWMNGYMYPSNWLAAVAARLRGTAVLSRSDLRLASYRKPHRAERLRDHMIRAWIRNSDAVLYIGEANREAYVHFGASPEQLYFTPYSVDVSAIREARERVGRDIAAARAALSLPGDRVIVAFVGKLTPLKHPEALLSIASDPELRDKIHVMMVGSGPLEHGLQAQCEREQISNVTFLGFVNQSRLPDVYALADLFVMPSDKEQWGLALNEAMASGLAPVVSDAVGACADLIVEGETGLSFPSCDWVTMLAQVRRLVLNEDLRNRISHNAAVRSERYSHEAAAEGVVDALRALGFVHQSLAASVLSDREATSSP